MTVPVANVPPVSASAKSRPPSGEVAADHHPVSEAVDDLDNSDKSSLLPPGTGSVGVTKDTLQSRGAITKEGPHATASGEGEVAGAEPVEVGPDAAVAAVSDSPAAPAESPTGGPGGAGSGGAGSGDAGSGDADSPESAGVRPVQV